MDVRPITFPDHQPNLSGLQHLYMEARRRSADLLQFEVMSLNDCLYRNIYRLVLVLERLSEYSFRYSYIAVYDTDEVIVPRTPKNWTEMMSFLNTRGKHDSWYFRNVYFFEDAEGLAGSDDVEANDIPGHLHMLRYIYRSSRYTPWNVKSLHDAGGVLTIHNHQPLKCLGAARCRFAGVSPTVAHLQHYKMNCAPGLQSVCQAGRDTTLLRETTRVLVWRVVGNISP